MKEELHQAEPLESAWQRCEVAEGGSYQPQK